MERRPAFPKGTTQVLARRVGASWPVQGPAWGRDGGQIRIGEGQDHHRRPRFVEVLLERDLEVTSFEAVGAIEVERGPAQLVAWHLAPGAHGSEVGPGLTRIATGLGIGCSELARDMAGDSREAA